MIAMATGAVHHFHCPTTHRKPMITVGKSIKAITRNPILAREANRPMTIPTKLLGYIARGNRRYGVISVQDEVLSMTIGAGWGIRIADKQGFGMHAL